VNFGDLRGSLLRALHVDVGIDDVDYTSSYLIFVFDIDCIFGVVFIVGTFVNHDFMIYDSILFFVLQDARSCAEVSERRGKHRPPDASLAHITCNETDIPIYLCVANNTMSADAIFMCSCRDKCCCNEMNMRGLEWLKIKDKSDWYLYL
jgi:hypothetical protein